jgi:uncharacterized membrane protein YccF (DUF307 family)
MTDAQDSPTERTDVPATPAVAQWNPPPTAPPPAAAPQPAAAPPPPTWSAPPSTGPSLWIRAIWFIFIGWWLSAFAIGVAYFLVAIIVGIPLGFMIFNLLPMILTLRPRTEQAVYGGAAEQLPIWIRAIWFILVGWWLGAIYISIAWFLCVILITLPIGLWLFNRIGAVMTLLRY